MSALKIYAVALSFANGVGGMSMIPCATEAMAVGAAVAAALRGEPKPEGELTHVMAKEVDVAFLRMLIQAAETGQAGADRVVHLVQPPTETEVQPPPGEAPPAA